MNSLISDILSLIPLGLKKIHQSKTFNRYFTAFRVDMVCSLVPYVTDTNLKNYIRTLFYSNCIQFKLLIKHSF